MLLLPEPEGYDAFRDCPEHIVHRCYCSCGMSPPVPELTLAPGGAGPPMSRLLSPKRARWNLPDWVRHFVPSAGTNPLSIPRRFPTCRTSPTRLAVSVSRGRDLSARCCLRTKPRRPRHRTAPLRFQLAQRIPTLLRMAVFLRRLCRKLLLRPMSNSRLAACCPAIRDSNLNLEASLLLPPPRTACKRRPSPRSALSKSRTLSSLHVTLVRLGTRCRPVNSP